MHSLIDGDPARAYRAYSAYNAHASHRSVRCGAPTAHPTVHPTRAVLQRQPRRAARAGGAAALPEGGGAAAPRFVIYATTHVHPPCVVVSRQVPRGRSRGVERTRLRVAVGAPRCVSRLSFGPVSREFGFAWFYVIDPHSLP